jgi:hypothetical protein
VLTTFETVNILVFVAFVLGGADAHGFLQSPRYESCWNIALLIRHVVLHSTPLWHDVLGINS